LESGRLSRLSRPEASTASSVSKASPLLSGDQAELPFELTQLKRASQPDQDG